MAKKDQEYKGSSSNIAYIGVDMVNGHDMSIALRQVDDLKKVKPSAWFVDIVHRGDQFGEALNIKNYLEQRLKELNPWETYGDTAVTVRLNMPMSGNSPLRARDEMNKEINRQKKLGRAENVKFRDPSGTELPIEY